MRKAYSLFLLAALTDCGNPDPHVFGPHLDLSKPVRVVIEEKYTADGQASFPAPAAFKSAFEGAVGSAGGSVTQDVGATQVITIYDTDGGPCLGDSVFAFTEFPLNGRIAVCHSLAVLNGDYAGDPRFYRAIALHEMGHEMSGQGWHIGGDAVPNGQCPYPDIMAWNARCHLNVTTYLGADLSYVCSGETVNGICAGLTAQP